MSTGAHDPDSPVSTADDAENQGGNDTDKFSLGIGLFL